MPSVGVSRRAGARTVARVGADGISGREPADVEVRRVAPLPPPHRRLDVREAVLCKLHQTRPHTRTHPRTSARARASSMNASISAFVAAPTWLQRHGVARPRSACDRTSASAHASTTYRGTPLLVRDETYRGWKLISRSATSQRRRYAVPPAEYSRTPHYRRYPSTQR